MFGPGCDLFAQGSDPPPERDVEEAEAESAEVEMMNPTLKRKQRALTPRRQRLVSRLRETSLSQSGTADVTSAWLGAR